MAALSCAATSGWDCLWTLIGLNYKCSVPQLSRARGCPLMISSDGSFHIGDKVVYPNHGVGIIEQSSSRTIGASGEKVYLLKMKASSLKAMVPFHNVASVAHSRGVRHGEIQKILDLPTDGGRRD